MAHHEVITKAAAMPVLADMAGRTALITGAASGIGKARACFISGGLV
jgi:hypothetical protein